MLKSSATCNRGLGDRSENAAVEVRCAYKAARDEAESKEKLIPPASVLLVMAQFGEKPDGLFLHE